MNNSPLQARREQMNGLTQSELSIKTGVDQGAISAIEAGTRRLTLNTAGRLNTYLDICPYQLVLENSFWLATNGEADFEVCEEIGEVMAKHIRRLPDSQRQVGLDFACNFGKARLTIGGTVINQIVTEYMPPPPSVLLTNEQAAKRREANQAAGAKFRAQQEQEDGEIAPAPSILLRGKESFQIKEKLERGPGVVIPDSGLRTARREIEQIPPAPAILLANVNEPKSADREPKVDPLEHVSDSVPDPPSILTQPPKIIHNQLCFQDSVINGGGDE